VEVVAMLSCIACGFYPMALQFQERMTDDGDEESIRID